MCAADGAELGAGAARAQPEVETRFDDVPAVNKGNPAVTGTRYDAFYRIRDQIEQPPCLRGKFADPVAIEPVAIHPEIDQRRAVQHRCELARDLGSMEVVDLGMECCRSGWTGASRVRRDQQDGPRTF